MKSISIKVLIELLSNHRRDNNLSSNFIKAFTSFLKALPSSDAEIYASEYFLWVKNKNKIHKNYRGTSSDESILKMCKKDKDLFLDIRKNGLQDPIRIFREPPYGFEIDGYHRLCIMDTLGYSEISYILNSKNPVEVQITEKELEKFINLATSREKNK